MSKGHLVQCDGDSWCPFPFFTGIYEVDRFRVTGLGIYIIEGGEGYEKGREFCRYQRYL